MDKKISEVSPGGSAVEDKAILKYNSWNHSDGFYGILEE